MATPSLPLAHRVPAEPPSRVLLYHKPKGVTVTRDDERGARTVYDVLPAWVRGGGWVPVGRLDKDSRGLLLFVREGALVEMLTRPGGCVKTYHIAVRGRVTEEHLRQAREGVETPSGRLAVRSVQVLGAAGPKTRLQVTLAEGKNRHLRKLFGALRDPVTGAALKVMDLQRVAFGSALLNVPSGTWRFLNEAEITRLLRG